MPVDVSMYIIYVHVSKSLHNSEITVHGINNHINKAVAESVTNDATY